MLQKKVQSQKNGEQQEKTRDLFQGQAESQNHIDYKTMADCLLFEEKYDEALVLYLKTFDDWNKVTDLNSISLDWFEEKLKKKEIDDNPTNSIIFYSIMMHQSSVRTKDINLRILIEEMKELENKKEEISKFHADFVKQAEEEVKKRLQTYRKEMRELKIKKDDDIAKINKKLKKLEEQNAKYDGKNKEKAGKAKEAQQILYFLDKEKDHELEELRQRNIELEEENNEMRENLNFIQNDKPISHLISYSQALSQELIEKQKEIKELSDELTRVRQKNLKTTGSRINKSRISGVSMAESKNVAQ